MFHTVTSLLSQLRRLWRPAITMVAVLAAWTRCVEWKQPTEAEEQSVARFVSAVQTVTGDAHAVLRTGNPSATNGPIVTSTLPQMVLLGGTLQTTVSATTPFTKVAIVVPGVSDYWELTLVGATTSAEVLIVFSQDIPTHVFELQMGGSNGSSFGAFQKSPLSVIAVGTGDVQVNVTWDSPADVDLHVLDPSGAEIYWAQKRAVSGGQLDLDSNAGCSSDGPRAENVFWPSGLVAPKGEFVVRVDHWSNCGAAATHYVVTVNARGLAPQVFSGVLTGSGDGGGKGAGANVATLNY